MLTWRGCFPWHNPDHFLELRGFVHKLVRNAKPTGRAVALRPTADVKPRVQQANCNAHTISYIRESGKNTQVYKIWCPNPRSWKDLGELWPCSGVEGWAGSSLGPTARSQCCWSWNMNVNMFLSVPLVLHDELQRSLINNTFKQIVFCPFRRMQVAHEHNSQATGQA